MTQGLGLGAQAFGWWTIQCTTSDGTIDFAQFWYAPAIVAGITMLFFAIAFWDKSADENVESAV